MNSLMKFFKSFRYAACGIKKAALRERNIRFDICMAVYTVILGAALEISLQEWIGVIFSIAIVISAELLNTAFEELCDSVHPNMSEKICRIKDVSAGGVLMCAAGAAVIGVMIFFKKIRFAALAAFIKTNPYISAVIFLSLIPAAIFVFGMKDKKEDEIEWK